MDESLVAINTYLKPLVPFLEKEGVSEISLNQPGELWIEEGGDIQCFEVPALDQAHLLTLSNLVATQTSQEIDEERPLLSATLPGGYRIQIVLPPAVEKGSVALSIRKQALLNFSLEDYEKQGAFQFTNQLQKKEAGEDHRLKHLLLDFNFKEFIKQALLLKKNILVSAGTSTGKTTFLNACLKVIPEHERIITIEDAREVRVEHPNKVHLLASRGGQGKAKLSPQDLLEATLRLRPDRIIMGELRGKEAFSYLRAVNSGHPGSITTIHANNPTMALEQLALMVMQNDIEMNPDQIRQYVKSIIPIVVQLKREKGGFRHVAEICYQAS